MKEIYFYSYVAPDSDTKAAKLSMKKTTAARTIRGEIKLMFLSGPPKSASVPTARGYA